MTKLKVFYFFLFILNFFIFYEKTISIPRDSLLLLVIEVKSIFTNMLLALKSVDMDGTQQIAFAFVVVIMLCIFAVTTRA